MESYSDLPVMKEAAKVLNEFDVSAEVRIVSAHRTPELMFSYATSARERGIQVIIADAIGAAHLPGMVAALTPLPVIGVPVRASTLDGLDSLLSIVQMPRGVPVSTVAQSSRHLQYCWTVVDAPPIATAHRYTLKQSGISRLRAFYAEQLGKSFFTTSN
ncbi:uncharacterized protein LOC143556836 [Bidens hawaiensis]|uniref:uncharacterized protein LOC143556836 n=1 Tax=Bidens hawaiensis TaxID=980011 RepID=UPI0040499E15